MDDGTDGTTAAETSLRYDPSLTQEQVDTLTLAVGPVAAAPATERIDGVDVTLELGQDFLAFLQAAAEEAAAQGGGQYRCRGNHRPGGVERTPQ